MVVTGEYEVGMQDQAFLGPESGLAIPAEDGGVDLFIATQWLHVDRDQVAAALDLPVEKVRFTLAGVGGAFGGREDLSMQIHACLLALHTGRPVKMVYGREESFFGHVHRHPGADALRARRDARRQAGRTSARGSCSTAARTRPPRARWSRTRRAFALGPYEVPSARIDSYVVYTDNPPCGAMRGFGAVQTCFAHEAQMDKLAAALDMDPVELRRRNAMTTGIVDADRRADQLPRAGRRAAAAGAPSGRSRTASGGAAGRGRATSRAARASCAASATPSASRTSASPRASTTTRPRACGCRRSHGEPLVEVHTAAAEVGQGLVTVMAQIARTELGVENVLVLPADTQVGSAGSSCASRQTHMTGGAVQAACRGGARGVGARAARSATASRRRASTTTGRRSRSTRTGQGDAHVTFAFAAHRAVVDVDAELGLVRVVEIATAQDVGKAMNPLAVEGQIEGGIAQGLGLALMEEIQVVDGLVRNASFTDYLIPTILDMPPVELDVLELGDPDSPYGLRGIGEPPTISSTPAVVAALRAATGPRAGARAGPAG